MVLLDCDDKSRDKNKGIWLLKTCHGCQGRGVDLVTDLAQFKEDFKEVKNEIQEHDDEDEKEPS